MHTMPTLEDCKEDCTIIPIGTENCRTAGASDFKERNPMNSEEQQSVFSIRSPSSALRLKKLPSLFKNSAEADLILPCCINPSKGKKRRAVATDGPLLNVATSKFWQTNDLSEPISHTSLLLHSGEQMLATEKVIIFLTQEEEDKPDVPSRTKNPTSAASPPYTPPRTPILASPVTNVLSSCFGSLALQSPSSCFSAFTSPGRLRSVSIHDQSPSSHGVLSPVSMHSRRRVPVTFVGSDNTHAPRNFAMNQQRDPLDSPKNSALALSQPMPTPCTDKKRSTGIVFSPRLSSKLHRKELHPPISFLDIGRIEKNAAAGKQRYTHQSLLLSSSNATNDFAFVFNDASDDSLTDNDDDGDHFFLRKPDKKDTFEHAKKAKHLPFVSPSGVDKKRSSFNKTSNTLNDINSTVEPCHSYKIEAPKSTNSSSDSLFGMGVVHDNPQFSFDGMDMFNSFSRPIEQTGAHVHARKKSRYSSSSTSLFDIGIVHEHHSQAWLDEDMAICILRPRLRLSLNADSLNGAAIVLPLDDSSQVCCSGGICTSSNRDLITPPVMCTHASNEPPELKQRSCQTAQALFF